MSQQRLDELTELVDELYLLKGVDTSNFSVCSHESSIYGRTPHENNFIYYSLRFKSDHAYSITLKEATKRLIRE